MPYKCVRITIYSIREQYKAAVQAPSLSSALDLIKILLESSFVIPAYVSLNPSLFSARLRKETVRHTHTSILGPITTHMFIIVVIIFILILINTIVIC